MRHRRPPEPGAQTRADQRGSTRRGGPYEPPPWAADSANDNGQGARSHLHAVQPDWEDDATTLYRRSDVNLRSLPRTHPRNSVPPAAPQPTFQGRPSTPDEPRFALEGSLRRSVQPQAAPKPAPSRWRALPGLLLLGVCAVFSVRALHWPAFMPLGHLPAPTPTLTPVGAAASSSALPASPEPAQPVAAAVPPAAVSGEGASVETFSLEESAALLDGAHVKRPRAAQLRKQRLHAQRSQRHGRAGLSRVIQPLRDAPDDDEPEVAPVRKDEGILQVNSRPWARVLVDGRFVGHTPQLGLRVSAGKHRVQLVNEQMDMSKAFDVTIRAGQTLSRVELLDDNPSSRR